MSELILPGEQVPAQHVNLKLGPGLIQSSNVGREGFIISTKAGELKHSANNSRWWIESNARRVRNTTFQRSIILKGFFVYI